MMTVMTSSPSAGAEETAETGGGGGVNDRSRSRPIQLLPGRHKRRRDERWIGSSAGSMSLSETDSDLESERPAGIFIMKHHRQNHHKKKNVVDYDVVVYDDGDDHDHRQVHFQQQHYDDDGDDDDRFDGDVEGSRIHHRHHHHRRQRQRKRQRHTDQKRQRRTKQCHTFLACLGVLFIVLALSARVITTSLHDHFNSQPTDHRDDEATNNNSNTNGNSTVLRDSDGVLLIPTSAWDHHNRLDQHQQQQYHGPASVGSETLLRSKLSECPGRIIQHPEYDTASAYFQHLNALGDQVHVPYSINLEDDESYHSTSTGSSSSSSNTNTNNIQGNGWTTIIMVDNCHLDCHDVEVRVNLFKRRRRRRRRGRRGRDRKRDRRRTLLQSWNNDDDTNVHSTNIRSTSRSRATSTTSATTKRQLSPQSDTEGDDQDHDAPVAPVPVPAPHIISIFRVINGGYVSNCNIRFDSVDDDDDEDADITVDGVDGDSMSDGGVVTTQPPVASVVVAGVFCPLTIGRDCTVDNVRCDVGTETTTTTPHTTTTPTGSEVESGDSFMSGFISSCIFIDETTKLNTMLSTSITTTTARIIGGRASSRGVPSSSTSLSSVFHHGILIWLPTSSAAEPDNIDPSAATARNVIVSDFVVDRMSRSGIKVMTVDSARDDNSQQSQPRPSSSSSQSSTAAANIRLTNVTSVHNGGDGLELDMRESLTSTDDDDKTTSMTTTMMMMISGGLYGGNVGNGINMIIANGQNVNGDSDGNVDRPIVISVVIADSTSIRFNGQNGIRVKPPQGIRRRRLVSSLRMMAEEEEPTPRKYANIGNVFQLAIDTVSVRDNAWFGILVLDDDDDDISTSAINDPITSSDDVGRVLDLLLRNVYVARNGHDGLMVVAQNTTTTIEQSSFIQNGYFNSTSAMTEATDRPSSLTPSSSSSSSARSSPYGSGASIYEPFSIFVKRTEFIHNLQDGLSITNLQLQNMIKLDSNQSVGDNGSSPSRIAAVQLSYVVLNQNDRDGLVIVDADSDDESGQSQSTLFNTHVEIDNVKMCSNRRNGLTLYHLKSLEINSGVVSCHNSDGNVGWDLQLGGIMGNVFSTTGAFAAPMIVGDTCTNANGESRTADSGNPDVCSSEKLVSCEVNSCDSPPSSDDLSPNIGALSVSDSLEGAIDV